MRDVVIIGAGPAGLAAAARFHELGLGKSVTIVEREQEAGGIPRHCGHATFGLYEFHRLMTGPDYAKRLTDRIGECDLRTNCTILKLNKAGRLSFTSTKGEEERTAKHVLLCTGIRETPRAQRAIAGARPYGIMNTGRLQQHIYLHGDKPFTNPVIIGSELVAFSAILTLRHAGIKPRALIEASSRIQAMLGMDWGARLAFGIPVLTGTQLLGINGINKVEGITIDRGFGPEDLSCDGVILTGQFRPENALLIDSPLALSSSKGPAIDADWHCSDPSFFAAGNGLGWLRTAGTCWRQGRKAAEAIARSLQ